MQVWVAIGQSFLVRHWTQMVATHAGAVLGQFMSLVHWTQRPRGLHTGVDVPAQSVFDTHSTHDDVEVLQWGAGCPHCESWVHPTRHTKSVGSQIGAAVPQSAFDVQVTQRPSFTRHRGACAGQSPLLAHCTHCPSAVSQIFALPIAQSLDELHPTHAPPFELQMGA
jgi:hypothetical protein